MKSVFDGTYHFKNSLLLLSANRIEGFTEEYLHKKSEVHFSFFYPLGIQRRYQENKCMPKVKMLLYVQS